MSLLTHGYCKIAVEETACQGQSCVKGLNAHCVILEESNDAWGDWASEVQDVGLLLHILQGWSAIVDLAACSLERQSCGSSHQNLSPRRENRRQELHLQAACWICIHTEMEPWQRERPEICFSVSLCFLKYSGLLRKKDLHTDPLSHLSLHTCELTSCSPLCASGTHGLVEDLKLLFSLSGSAKICLSV